MSDEGADGAAAESQGGGGEAGGSVGAGTAGVRGAGAGGGEAGGDREEAEGEAGESQERSGAGGAGRELRDRWLEQVNEENLVALPMAKYEVARIDAGDVTRREQTGVEASAFIDVEPTKMLAA